MKTILSVAVALLVVASFNVTLAMNALLVLLVTWGVFDLRKPRKA